MVKIISYVAGTFISKDLEIYNITNYDIGTVLEAPAWITNTLLYSVLSEQNLLHIVNYETSEPAKKLINEPAKEPEPEPEVPEAAPEAEPEAPKKRTTKKK